MQSDSGSLIHFRNRDTGALGQRWVLWGRRGLIKLDTMATVMTSSQLASSFVALIYLSLTHETCGFEFISFTLGARK